MTLRIEPGVNLANAKEEILFGHTAVALQFVAFGHPCIIAEDVGESAPFAAKHSNGNALDYRIDHLNETERALIVLAITEAIGSHFSVTLNGAETMIHVEVI